MIKFFIQSLWRDEAFSYLLAKNNIFQILYLTAKDFNPPLYYLALHFWMKTFGRSEIGLRSLSLIFFWATLYYAFLFLSQILKISEKKSLLYLIIFLVNPFLSYYAFEVRMYTMLTFFATASFYHFFKKEKKPYLIFTILGLYTHYFMLIVVLIQGVSLLMSHLKKEKVFYQLKLIIACLLSFLPWSIFFLIQKIDRSSFWISKTSLKDMIYLPATIFSGYEKDFWFLTTFKYQFSPILKYFSLLIIFLVVVGLIKITRKNKNENKLVIYLFLWAFLAPLIIFLISLVKPIFLPRYLIFSSVGLMLLLIFCLEQISLFPRTVLIISIILFSLIYQILQINFRTKTDMAKTINEIRAISKPNDLLYVTSELDFHTAQYYFDEHRVYIYEKKYEKIPNYTGKILIPKERFTNDLPFYPNKAFVLKPDATYGILSD